MRGKGQSWTCGVSCRLVDSHEAVRLNAGVTRRFATAARPRNVRHKLGLMALSASLARSDLGSMPGVVPRAHCRRNFDKPGG